MRWVRAPPARLRSAKAAFGKGLGSCAGRERAADLATHCSRLASSARKASPVESAVYGCVHNGTEPRPTALSHREPSAPKASRMLRCEPQHEAPATEADAEVADAANDLKMRLLPLPVAPTITMNRQSSGNHVGAGVTPLSTMASSTSLQAASCHMISASGKRVSSGMVSAGRSSTILNSPPARPVHRSTEPRLHVIVAGAVPTPCASHVCKRMAARLPTYEQPV